MPLDAICLRAVTYELNNVLAGCRVENQGEFFHEFVTVSDAPAESILSALEKEGILGGYPLDEHRILWCCTEMNSKEDIDRAVAIVKGV